MQPIRIVMCFAALSACVTLLSCADLGANRKRETAVAAANASSPTPTSQPAAQPAGPKLQVADLHNVHRLTPTLYCGSVPDSDAQFAALAALGIKTIITVDGAKPSVDLADKHGMRYVHLPFGYDGIPRQRELEIARAVRDLPGPIYVHCHHGIHRGPAAAVVAAEAVAGWSSEQAVAALHQLGTGLQYEGLYAAARDFRKPTDAELNHADAIFPRVARLTDLANTMVEVDHHWDHLKAARKVHWAVPADHPDSDPAHEALLLKELLREAHRPGGPAEGRPADLLERMAVAERAASALEEALRANDSNATEIAATVMQTSCTACHAKYRDPGNASLQQ